MFMDGSQRALVGAQHLDEDEGIMSIALALAEEAGADLDIPVGCVVTDPGGAIIGTGRNRREKGKDATAHAEIEAIADACRTLGDWRLSGCSLYVTLEPCPMCAGAIIMARVGKLFYGARDGLTGSCGSVTNLFMEAYGHSTQVRGGILADECSAVLSDFFKGLRGR